MIYNELYLWQVLYISLHCLGYEWDPTFFKDHTQSDVSCLTLSEVGLDAGAFSLFPLDLIFLWESSLCPNPDLVLCLALLSGSSGCQRGSLPVQSIAHNAC